MRYLYYDRHGITTRVEIDNIEYIYLRSANKMDGFNSYIVHDVMLVTLEGEDITIFSESESICRNYMSKFENVNFIPFNDDRNCYYNKKYANIYRVLSNIKEPFFTDRSDFYPTEEDDGE